jgi:hypothetical protein
MKRTLSSIFTFILLGFLVIGAIGVFQNIVHDLHKTFSPDTKKLHLLSYERV